MSSPHPAPLRINFPLARCNTCAGACAAFTTSGKLPCLPTEPYLRGDHRRTQERPASRLPVPPPCLLDPAARRLPKVYPLGVRIVILGYNCTKAFTNQTHMDSIISGR